MSSKIQTDGAEHDETIVMNYKAQVKRSSLQHQTTRIVKERVLSPRGSRTVRLRDKSNVLKCGKPTGKFGLDRHPMTTGKIDIGSSVQSVPFRNYQKPWPGRNAAGVEELVRYMSNVPHYLQHMEQGGKIQEMALNFGVLDWKRLEKWTYKQKQVVNDRVGDSPSSSNTSSSFSTFGSSTQSCRSIGSPLAQKKKFHSVDDHMDLSAEGRGTNMTEKENSEGVIGFPDSRASPIKTSIGHRQLPEMDFHIGTDNSGDQHEKSQSRDLNMKVISFNMVQPSDIGTTPSTSKDHKASASAHNMVKVQDGRSGKVEKFRSYEQQNCGSKLSLARDLPQDRHLVVSQNIEGTWDHTQEKLHGQCFSFASAVNDEGRPIEMKRNSFSGNFPPKDVHFTSLSPHVPYSSPLPSTIQSDEPDASSTPLSENEVLSRGKCEKHNQFTDKFCEQFLVNMADKLGQAAKATTATGRKLSPSHQLIAGLNHIHRSSSLREGSSAGKMKWTACSDNSQGDKATGNSRGRRSPLRRILDPLLKSKNRTHFSGLIVESPIQNAHEPSVSGRPPMLEEWTSGHGPSKSFCDTINPPTSQTKGNLNSLRQVSTSTDGSLQDERHVASTRQALLQLTWKSGLPLLMFTSNDGNILAATMRKKSISDQNNFECIYTILSVHEVKKKSGVWIKHGNKSKNHGLVSNVVGQLKVSCSKLISFDSKGHSVVQEFVLFGKELIPAHHEPVSSIFESELAAVVVEIQKERPESCLGDMMKSGNCGDLSQIHLAEDKFSGYQVGSLQIKENPSSSSLSSIIALFPSGVHGMPATGEPSPLIERWKSGGICECGGWDEGCMLTILTNKVQENKSSSAAQASCTTDGTHRIELFVQGGTRENRHSFSLVACKEGMYTVEFRTSIALLQAFAFCIATIHSRKPTDQSKVPDSVEAKSLREQIFAKNTRMAPVKTQEGAPSSYVPHHPPLSPVGRA